MSTVIEGLLDGSGKKFGLVASRFNELITRKLVEGAMDCLIRHNVHKDAITLAWVPGAFEIPVIAQKMARSKQYDAVICLGAVIEGELPILITSLRKYQKVLQRSVLMRRCRLFLEF